MTEAEIHNLVQEARRIAEAQSDRFPKTSVYPIVLSLLDAIETAMGCSPLDAFEAARPLGVLAVRELDEADGPAGNLGSHCFEIREGLRILAGLPDYT